MPTRAEYVAAKQHQQDNPTLYAAADPIAEVLANVQIINAYEGGQVDDGTCSCVWYSPTEDDLCGCTHPLTDHVDGLCTAQPPAFR
jgi:hypothetical protein